MDMTHALDLDASAVGFHPFSRDDTLNYQANRWLHDDPQALEDFRTAAPSSTDLGDWTAMYLSLAKRVRDQGREMEAAFFARGAEFFMTPADPRKTPVREQFVSTVHRAFALTPEPVPFGTGALPAYELVDPDAQGDLRQGAHNGPRSTWVVFGGFDSYIEELFPALAAVAQRGRRVIAFEGPGQGGALEDHGLTMSADWAAPVSAVLDHFGIEEATALGLSLGGGLVMHAAAGEPRIKRVVACDVLDDFLEVLIHQAAGWALPGVSSTVVHMPDSIINRALSSRARHSLVVHWGLWQGMHVTGTDSPAQFVKKVTSFGTAPVSARVTADVLLMQGVEDHFVPNHQMPRQAGRLTSARSVTTRTFTRAENAASHCQTGNTGLLVRTALAWEDALMP